MKTRLLIAAGLWIGSSVTGDPSAGAAVPNQPSIVHVSGRQLIVQKRLSDGSLDAARPYIIKGINWNPSTRAPASGPDPDPACPNASVQYGYFFDDLPGNRWRSPCSEGHIVQAYWSLTQMADYYQTDIPLMKLMHVNTVRVFSDFGADPASKRILDAFYQNGIMVIMTVVEGRPDIDSGQYLASVQRVMNHPAILMWAVGNEWNYNTYYGTYATLTDAINATQSAALAIEAQDPNHPVSSSLADFFDNPADPRYVPALVASVPAVQLWGLNSYRGVSFYTLFQDWSATTTKPFYMGEFGIDGFTTTAYTVDPPGAEATNDAKVSAGVEDQATQSTADLALWNEIAGQLSALDSGLPCVGGNLFSFQDALWEVGNYNMGMGGLVDYNDGIPHYQTYDPDGFEIPGASPDNVTNEEYFGIVSADRAPKQAYYSMQTFYANLAPVVTPVVSYLNPPSATAGGSAFTLTLNGSHFTSDCYVLWNGTAKPAAYMNPTQLQVSVSAADVAQAGQMNLFVVNPSTTGGTSELTAFPVQQISGLDSARISPAPWRSDRHGGLPVTFDQLTTGSTVKIFTLSGHWVRTLPAPDGFVNWDRRNGDGEDVASGIYLYVITNNQGDRARGKLAIIR